MGQWIVNRRSFTISHLLLGLLLAAIISAAIPAPAISQECTQTLAELLDGADQVCSQFSNLPCGCHIRPHNVNNILVYTYMMDYNLGVCSNYEVFIANGCYLAICSDPTDLCCLTQDPCCGSGDPCCGVKGCCS